MDFGLYRQLWRRRPVRNLLLVAMVARLPHSAAGVMLTLHVVQTLGLGYGAAGTVAALLTIGIAVGAPWRGRRVDTAGLRVALIPSIIAEAVVWSVAPHLGYPGLLAAALVGGVFSLPIFSVVRQSLGAMTTPAERRTAFALDSICTEVTFMVGPALAALVAVQLSTVIGVTGVGVSAALAGLALVWFNPPTRSDQAGGALAPEGIAGAGANDDVASCLESAESAAPAEVAAGQADGASGLRRLLSRAPGGLRRGFGWLTVSVVVVLVVAAGSGIVLSGTDVGIVAVLRGHGEGEELGIVFLAWCLASLVGGLVYGAMTQRVQPLLLLLAMAALTIPMGFASDVWSLSLLSIPAGLLCAPTLSAASEAIAALVDEGKRGEAMGWYGSALTAGTALGSPFTGLMIDAAGPWAGFVGIGALGVLLCVAGLVAQSVRRRRRASLS
ncbi:MFS transporter [Sinomonas sp. JGH33]|uniref:MFS transporter n=1 Tax=Sinomonas terricola TaxID=3110330 RepID=A0ABU5T4E4_9MICC|nr:MFS transporter [Sinomonas sp. JGH33]MEA5454530.1 MFS transporter [Sinomonas sp. JGH33]